MLGGLGVALVAAGIALAFVLAGGGVDGGPVLSTDRNALSFPKRAGTTFTYGQPVVVDTGDDDAVSAGRRSRAPRRA